MNLLNSESPILEQSKKILLQLKPHQKTILHASNSLELGTTIKNEISLDSVAGVLADNVGSGKSLSILSIIANNPFLVSRNRCVKSINGMINVYNVNDKKKYLKTNILVVPHSIMNQWVTYINTYTKLSYYVINNTKSLKKITENLEILNQYCITLISSTKYKSFAEFYKYQNGLVEEGTIKYIVSRLIFDEADSINIPACPQIESVFYWFITSSYETLLNPNGKTKYLNPTTNEISSSYDWIGGFTKRIYIDGIKNTGFIKNFFRESYNTHFINIFIKNEDNFVSNSFNLPEPIINLIECSNPLLISILNGVIPKDVLVKLNAGDTKGAIESIDCTKTNENNLIKTVTEELQDKLHNTNLLLVSKEKMKFSSEKAKKESIMKIKIKISEINSKIAAITDRIKNSNMCTICYDKIQNNTIAKCCSHSFCFECITIWLSQSKSQGCPMCRSNITTNDLVVVSNECSNLSEEKKESNTKIDNFNKILSKIDENSKILIFSEFDATFDNIKEILDTQNINYSRVIGTSKSIDNIVHKFKLNNQEENSIQVLLLNSKYFGSGINLENTTDLIIFHTMNNDLNKQIVGRAQRPGRKTPLKIWRLCHENEMQESFNI